MSSTSKGGRDSIYDTAFKIAVAREYVTGNLGYGKLAVKHGLKITTVRFFVRWYKAHYTQINEVVEQEQSSAPAAQKEQLQRANLKITALELLIENAGKELGVDLVKKFGSKQSGK